MPKTEKPRADRKEQRKLPGLDIAEEQLDDLILVGKECNE